MLKSGITFKVGGIISILLILWVLGGDFTYADGPLTPGGRLIHLTLIPDYEEGTIHFDGWLIGSDEAPVLPDLAGLPVDVETKWPDETGKIWYILGDIKAGQVVQDPTTPTYHLLIGSMSLRSRDEVRFSMPFANLDYSQIRPFPDVPDQTDMDWRLFTHHFSYKAGITNREIDSLDIPFTPVQKQIDLVLTPLMGEVLVGETDGLRLSGEVSFETLVDYTEFSRHCQSISNRVRLGDYRIADLLFSLDYPHYSGFASLNSAFDLKSTRLELISDLLDCQYDHEKNFGQVSALFSGRLYHLNDDHQSFPQFLKEQDSLDSNDLFNPPLSNKRLREYEIRFGKLVLAPGDVLTVTVPYVHLQADTLEPTPATFIYPNGGQPYRSVQVIYRGPKTFDLSIRYVPGAYLFLSQFPAILRPGLELIENEFRGLLTAERSLATWAILIDAGLLLLTSKIVSKGKRWFSFFAWLLASIGLLYAFRGSFGLLFVVLALYLTQPFDSSSSTTVLRLFKAEELVKALGVGVLIIVAMVLDVRGTTLFRALSTPDLSPLTPAILLGLSVTMFFWLYGWPRAAILFRFGDVPVLAFLLVTLCTYDALDKSLLALLIIGLGAGYIFYRLERVKEQKNINSQPSFVEDFWQRLSLAFTNRWVLWSILILIVFAVGNDLASPYANALYLARSWLIAPFLPVLLTITSVSFAFLVIALLFILLYPIIPSEVGYIKALVFALFFLLIFLFGVGTENRLIYSLPTVLVGRGVYYLSIPLFLGIYFDAPETKRKLHGAVGVSEEKTGQNDNKSSWQQLLRLMENWRGILALVVPSYVFIFDQPMIATYFNLLERLVLLAV